MTYIVSVHNRAMTKLVALVILGCVACTARNPAFCGDGTCIDPERPFCDVDGSFAGTPGTCISVACTPGMFAACRGNEAVTCAGGGNTYDVVECPLGCDDAASGCRQCTTNAQCDATVPVCDPETSACRTCRTDDECDSRVCEAGTCIPASDVVYAAAGAFGSCTLTQPCSIADAVIFATNANVQPIIRMLPGTYSEALSVVLATAQPLRIVASGATLAVGGDTPAITVDKGATIDVRDISVTSGRLLVCGSATAAQSAATLRDGTLLALGGSAGGAVELSHCSLTLNAVGFESGNDTIALRDSSSLHADRARFHANNVGLDILQANSKNVDVVITNSILENVAFVPFSTDTTDPGSRYTLAYDTLIYDRRQDACSGTTVAHRTIRFENSILAQQSGSLDAVTSPNPANCTFVSTLLSHQTAPAPTGTLVADPQFVDEPARDFHLMATSPAVDAATAGTINSDHDVDGTARPQGAKSDLGAYELKP